MPTTRTQERRWIVLATDGRHVTIGRNSDPTEEEIAVAEQSLAASGLAGWLAIMQGDYYLNKRKPELMLVRPLAQPTTSFEVATIAFEANRRNALK